MLPSFGKSKKQSKSGSARSISEEHRGQYVGTPMNDMPILEDDETENEDVGPLFPTFNNPPVVSPKDKSPDSGKSEPDDLRREIDEDFDQDFYRDTKDIQSPTPVQRPKNPPTVAFDEDSSEDVSTDEDLSSQEESEQAPPSRAQGSPTSSKTRIKRSISLNPTDDQSQKGSPRRKRTDTLISRIFGGHGPQMGGGLTPGATRSSPEREEDEEEKIGNDIPLKTFDADQLKFEANGLVNQHFRDGREEYLSSASTLHPNNSGVFMAPNPEIVIGDFDDLNNDDYAQFDPAESIVDRPRRVRKGVVSSLLALYNPHNSSAYAPSEHSGAQTPRSEYSDMETRLSLDGLENKLRKVQTDDTYSLSSPSMSSLPTESLRPKGFGDNFLHKHKRGSRSASSLSHMFKGSKKEEPKQANGDRIDMPSFAKPKQQEKKKAHMMAGFESNFKSQKRKKLKRKFKSEQRARITVHIADVLQRQRFILTLCKAFMLYGAPTHRLEEYMSMTARVLEIDGSFIYFPGCMIVSFGDAATHTSDMKLVRCAQGLDLGKLDETHDIYKAVVHDRIGVEEASGNLDEILGRKPRFNKWICVLLYAFSSAMVTPWGFGGSWIDMPISFGIGLLIGFLQFFISPRSVLYSSVFEVSSCIVASFIGRAIGSINGGDTFCFAAIVQGSLALILPGYIILCGSLELQSRNLVAGSVRMFYAFIYSLMMSFGITLGAALYGWIDRGAVSHTSCTSNVQPAWRILLVPLFTIGLALINQSSWSQLPIMVFISGSGYVVTYFSGLHFKLQTEFNATLGCFIIGLVSNAYTRLLKSFNKIFSKGSFMTVSIMLPAVFVQVPSGIASQGSLLVGVDSANNLVNGTSSSTDSSTSSISFGMVMIQVALGISIGLFMATLVVYPLGKKRTGLFTL
ncbi:hypothetical protein OGAPHI_005690 [Ogataea philodendri]|uniref:Threonine/serine exporter-like N-terminal domain-containing protein n=1 Tax=Ogataea philodendri TaxID=1378263 RepID=A0A9P8NY92_9ASCO|nr:uncharacterized protein OGAPHI_005690 [Ogataea philodendri]KAH3662438.1 hypothetical protein OGAPHI_005690 [Ogataea philodendri]